MMLLLLFRLKNEVDDFWQVVPLSSECLLIDVLITDVVLLSAP